MLVRAHDRGVDDGSFLIAIGGHSVQDLLEHP